MNVFDLQAKIRLDDSEYKNGLSAIKGTLADFAKFSAATLGAAATGVSAIVKESVSAYADYEQLAGGIETLFGSSAETVMKNAEKAYQTAGQSMNEYMETSIQSAAALINSLGGDQAKAAELMDLSITDMADNVNKLGTSVEGVQNAYRGFSRGNFTMLDNLALGFAGTKEGMQELLDKAQEISGIQYDISSYSDIVQAIHVVQEEMGITGTTAKEASGTISGSISSVKAAWENLKVEISKDDGNVGDAFDKLSETAGAAFDNMLPRVEKALDGVGDLIVKGAPKIGKSISKIVPRIMPSLMEASVSIVGALGTGIIENIPTLLQTGGEVIGMLGDTIESNLPKLKDTARQAITGFSGYLRENLPTLIPEGVSAVGEFVKGLTSPETTGTLLTAASDIVTGLINGLTSEKTLNQIVTDAPIIVDNIVTGITNGVDKLADAALTLTGNLLSYLSNPENRQKLEECGEKILDSVAAGFTSMLGSGANFTYDLGGEIAKNIGLADYWTVGDKAFNDFWKGFSSDWEEFKTWFNLQWKDLLSPTSSLKSVVDSVSGKVSDLILDREKETDAPFNYDELDTLPAYGPSPVPDEYRRKHGSLADRHAKGGIFAKPYYASGDWFGENGREALLPLDNNTAWMDKLVDKINGSGGTRNYYITINANHVDTEADFDILVEKIDHKLAERNVSELRAVGATGW